MKADSLKISKVFQNGGDIHFVLPHFQREYSWEEKQWKTLVEDACAIHDEMLATTGNGQSPKELEHFLGALVVINDGTRNGTVPAFKLVDGQQRLTTISLMLCALEQVAQATHAAIARKIRKLLVNADEDGEVYFKLLPTKKYGDRAAYIALIKDNASVLTESRIPAAYNYLLKELRQRVISGSVDIDKLFLVLTNSFQVVFIDLNQQESAYRIFESLNAKGKPLTQADLVRNYIAMKLPAPDQEEVFTTHWNKIETLLQERRTVGRSRLGELTAFIRHYLALQTGSLCSEEHVYARFRDRMEREFFETPDFEAEINKLRHFAEHYDKLLRPGSEGLPEIREAMTRLNKLETSTAYPFLLAVYNAFSTNQITKADLTGVLQTLENYLVRRFFVGAPTNYLNKMFPVLWGQVDKTQCVESLREILAGRNYPSDTRVFQSLLSKPLYDNSTLTRDRTALILETVNRHLSKGSGGYTVLDKSETIEHILPQTPGSEWQEELGPLWEQIHRDYLHTLGNLTLVTQEWNSSLSNAPFSVKKAKLSTHALRLNADYFSQELDVWDEKAILQRGEWMAKEVLAVWPAFKEEGLSAPITAEQKVEPSNFNEGCMERVGAFLHIPFKKHSKNLYVSSDGMTRVVCAVSKEYSKTNSVEYWHAFHPAQQVFLEEGQSSYVAYGCGSKEKVILMPYADFKPLVEHMWTTENENRRYWHVKIYESGKKFFLAQPAKGDRQDITQYLLADDAEKD